MAHSHQPTVLALKKSATETIFHLKAILTAILGSRNK